MQKHTKQLIAAVALLLIAAVPLALHIANADSTDETVASAAASSSEAQAEAPVSSSAASAADSTSEPEPQPEEEPDASSEEADSSAESGDASASSSEAAASSKPAAHSAASSPRRFFEARCTFGGVVPRGIVLAFGRFVSCGVLFVFVFDVGLVRQLAYNGDHGCKGQCVCAAAPEPAKTQQQKTVSDRKQCVQ